jgi:hypothetical protein
MAMNQFRGAVLTAALGLGLSQTQQARACNDEFPERYRSDLTVWCVYEPAWTDHQADIEGFFSFGDDAVTKMIEVFNVNPNDLPDKPHLPYTIEVGQSDGIAHTPSNFGPGVRVTGDAFWNEFGGVQGYWGYLLTLHEFVNQWTGLVTGGWPTDWWADHRSPFPNAMDYRVFDDLGYPAVAEVHRNRFIVPGTDGYDEQVVLFGETLFNLPNFGFEGYSRSFALIQADQMSWNKLRDPPNYQEQTQFGSGNPSGLLSEYIIAYLSLGAGSDQTQPFLDTGVGQQPSNWIDPPWQAYAPSSQAVGDIADAHCSLAAASAAIANAADATASDALTAAREAFWKGDYVNATAVIPNYPGVCGDCPSECGCKSDTDRCVAPWRADTAGPNVGGTGGGSGTVAAAGSGGVMVMGGTAGDANAAAGFGGDPAANQGGTTASGGVPTGGGPGATGGSVPGATDGTTQAAGCGCNVPSDSVRFSSLGFVALLGGVFWIRRRVGIKN